LNLWTTPLWSSETTRDAPISLINLADEYRAASKAALGVRESISHFADVFCNFVSGSALLLELDLRDHCKGAEERKRSRLIVRWREFTAILSWISGTRGTPGSISRRARAPPRSPGFRPKSGSFDLSQALNSRPHLQAVKHHRIDRPCFHHLKDAHSRTSPLTVRTCNSLFRTDRSPPAGRGPSQIPVCRQLADRVRDAQDPLFGVVVVARR